MKGKSRRTLVRHEVSDFGKVDRAVQKSYTKESTHNLETKEWSNGFFSAIKKMIAKITGFFKKKQPLHTGISTKSYCKKLGGAFGSPSRSGIKLAKKLTVHIPSKGA